MKIFYSKFELKKYLVTVRKKEKSIGFVPTMGALHQGHLSLVNQSIKKNDITVVSIFINPTQFDNQEDLDKYPQTLESDIRLLKSVNCHILFIPSVNEIYAKNVVSEKFEFDGLEDQMEGKFRDGHFNGVSTIVKTLFEIVAPENAYFGKKDFQQLQIIKKLVEKLNIPVEVNGTPIFREEDGLAMSSRNVRLTKEHREAAPFIYKTLKKAKKKIETKNIDELTQWVEKQFDKKSLLKLEYFIIADEKTLTTPKIIESYKKYRAFIAIFAGDIRLIDNIKL